MKGKKKFHKTVVRSATINGSGRQMKRRKMDVPEMNSVKNGCARGNNVAVTDIVR